MKKHMLNLTLCTLAVALVLSACASAAESTPTEAVETQETTAPTEALTEETTEEPTEEIPEEFTIQADADLQDAIAALYAACFPEEQVIFVDSDAVLVATAASDDETFTPSDLPATFLPDAVLISQTDAEKATTFIEFATSAAGQQVLIDLGLLPASITLTDQAGNTVEIPQPVQRVISSYGPATAIIYSVDGESTLVAASYLGAKDALGSTAMGNIDPRFEDLISDDYFSQYDFNLEEAVSRDPDLILANARSSWLDTVGELDIPVFLYDAETPELLIEAVLLTGQIFGPNSAAQAQAWVDYYDWVTNAILESTDTLTEADQPWVLFTGTSPFKVASGDMYQTTLMQVAGGISVSWELTGYWNEVNLEQIAAWDPDIIIVPPYGGATVAAITDNAEWQILEAVQAGQVFQMPKLVAPWDTPAPDSVLGIIWLTQVFFPDLESLDCSEQAEYFFNTFYDYAISAEELVTICAID